MVGDARRRTRPPRARSPGRRGRGGAGRRGAPPRRGRTRSQRSRRPTIATRRTAWRACASAPVATRQTIGERPKPTAAAIPTASGTRRLPRHDDREADGGGDEDRRQEVDRERGRAERREDDRRQPADDRVRREPGRVHRAQDREDRLGLARVPGAEARQQRRPVDGEHADPDDEGGDPRRGPGAAARPRPRYQPSSWPQIDAPQVDRRAGDDQQRRRCARGRPSTRAAPRATSGSRNGMKSSEKR